ncbi:D-sedoheptulose-7-phosphate isomerase [Brevundimonas diminuta]|uniref:D-sedoheptulose-7-phosphate isomerase n=1 Tax=Brevundimonas diminuta TaxID=293 RepID=UPI0025A502A9|nr:SIS domain-containing protein [Brevundimonas diminuta]MDM8353764.1 SIS domain-containing protein [Brevundimonas diminuta]
MTLFPSQPISGADQYLEAYLEEIIRAWDSVSRENILAAEILLKETISSDRTIFSCGNGGSAAISNHLLCDCLKGVQAGTSLKPRVHSLSSAPELMSAIVNDIGVEEMFALPLRSLGRPDDVLVAISSSGTSPNIVSAVRTAHDKGMKVLSLTGFDGGPVASEADISLHVAASNYGVIEDIHQSLMHILAQSLRMGALLDQGDLGHVRF